MKPTTLMLYDCSTNHYTNDNQCVSLSAMAEVECGRDCVCAGGFKPSVKEDFDSKRNERSLSIRMNTAYDTWFT